MRDTLLLNNPMHKYQHAYMAGQSTWRALQNAIETQLESKSYIVTSKLNNNTTKTVIAKALERHNTPSPIADGEERMMPDLGIIFAQSVHKEEYSHFCERL